MSGVPGLRVLVVDDEPLARLRLHGLLQAQTDPPVFHMDEAGTADEALARLAAHPVDVVLLDVQLPGRDGLKLAQALKALPQPPLVVFVTAHAEHALRAFELDALDYLTKPVRADRLHAALLRAAGRLALLHGAVLPAVTEPVLMVSDRGRVLRLPVRDVLYLRAEQKYVTLRTAERTLVLDDSLADLERRLGGGFVRVHRNALVAVAAVRELQARAGAEIDVDGEPSEGWAVRVAPVDEWLSVSRRQLAAVRVAMASSSN